MDVAFRILGNIEIHHVGDIVNINTAGRYICCNEDINLILTEFLHYPITLRLAQVPMEAFRLIATGGKGNDQFIHAFLGAAENDHLAVICRIKDSAQTIHFIARFIIILINGRSRHNFLVDGYHLWCPHVLFTDAQDWTGHRR